MALNYVDLDEQTRGCMLKELALDVDEKKVNYSSNFNEIGNSLWLTKFTEAIKSHDDDWLAAQLKRNECFLASKQFTTKTGKTSVRSVPITAGETFAEGEFNRLYMRAICIRALEGSGKVVVYRGKVVQNPRKESELKIGCSVSAKELLADLRNSQGRGTKLGIGEPNSGITVRLNR